MIEEYLVAGRRGRVTWTVRKRAFPYRWVIDGEIENGGRSGGVINYSLSSQGNGTFFERDFVYRMPNFLLTLLDKAALRRCVEAESTQALQQLKVVLNADTAMENA